MPENTKFAYSLPVTGYYHQLPKALEVAVLQEESGRLQLQAANRL